MHRLATPTFPPLRTAVDQRTHCCAQGADPTAPDYSGRSVVHMAGLCVGEAHKTRHARPTHLHAHMLRSPSVRAHACMHAFQGAMCTLAGARLHTCVEACSHARSHAYVHACMHAKGRECTCCQAAATRRRSAVTFHGDAHACACARLHTPSPVCLRAASLLRLYKTPLRARLSACRSERVCLHASLSAVLCMPLPVLFSARPSSALFCRLLRAPSSARPLQRVCLHASSIHPALAWQARFPYRPVCSTAPRPFSRALRPPSRWPPAFCVRSTRRQARRAASDL